MLFEQFERNSLSHYSYAVGCPADGRIAIVDPQRDVDIYTSFADSNGVRISHVLETHIHADFASGARELANRTGAALCLSSYDEGETYEVGFPHEELGDGDAIEIGAVKIQATHTPGHTPEHLSYLVFDRARTESVPGLFLSGDFLFVGSLGRPDLLGEDAKRDLAERMWRSVRAKLSNLPDGLEVHPGHGAGSMCGAGMSGRALSTLGFERAANPYLDPRLNEREFVEKLLASVPPFPDYYRRMKELNARGPRFLDPLPGLVPFDAEDFRSGIASGHVVIDLRDRAAYGNGHIPGAYAIGLDGRLSTWAAWVVPYETPILLVAPDSPGQSAVEEAVRALVRVGLDDVTGYLRGGMRAWEQGGLPVTQVPQIPSAELKDRLEAANHPLLVIDVRGDEEWSAGHIRDSIHVAAGELSERTEELPRDGRPIAVICSTGYRSSVATSVLERAGIGPLLNVTDGMLGWVKSGGSLTRG